MQFCGTQKLKNGNLRYPEQPYHISEDPKSISKIDAVARKQSKYCAA
jgi:hypothetical protein